jgi:hypothetical protein
MIGKHRISMRRFRICLEILITPIRIRQNSNIVAKVFAVVIINVTHEAGIWSIVIDNIGE